MIFDLNTYSVIVRIILAAVLSGFIGIERGRHGRAAGLRTYILVSVGAAIATMSGIYMVKYAGSGDPSRIASGVVSGVGFLGAGMIIIKSNKVTGLTTAAALWATATIGIALGAGFYAGALAGGLVIYITTTGLTALEGTQKQDIRFYLELSKMEETNWVISEIKRLFPECHDFDLMSPRSSLVGYIGLSVNIPLKSDSRQAVIDTLLALDSVIIALEE